MIRLVLAVLLAVAMVATATTALDDARRSRAQSVGEQSTTRLSQAVESLLSAESSVQAWTDAARRVVDVDVPAGGFTEARIAYVAVGGIPDRSVPADTDRTDVVAYRLAGSSPRVHALPVDLRVPSNHDPREGGRLALAPDDDPLVLRSSSAIRLGLLERAGRPVVLARRR